MNKLEIVQKRISRKCNDSFFYEGLIAIKGNWKLYAIGDIEIYQNDSIYDGNKARDNFDLPLENDKDLSLIEARGGEWVHNNWFEFINEVEGEEFVSGGGYKESIKELKTLKN